MSHKNENFANFKWRAAAGSVLLALSVFACNLSKPASSTPTTTPNIMWRETQTPLFPTNWPPTADTAWARYTFAYGSNPAQLMDGNYVSNPLSKTEWKTGVESTTMLSKEMTQAAIQGMVPLDEESQKALENGDRVSSFSLKLTEMPDPQMPETQEFLAYYRAWFKYNGAFLNLIRADHKVFIEWITEDD